MSCGVRPDETLWVAAHCADTLARELAKVGADTGWIVRARWALLTRIVYLFLRSVAPVVILCVSVWVGAVPGWKGQKL